MFFFCVWVVAWASGRLRMAWLRLWQGPSGVGTYFSELLAASGASVKHYQSEQRIRNQA